MSTNTTPRDIINAAELDRQEPLTSREAATILRRATDRIARAFLQPDTWQVGGMMETWECGERRLQGTLASYGVEGIRVTGRTLRHDISPDVPMLRVRVTLATEDGVEGGEVAAWMAV